MLHVCIYFLTTYNAIARNHENRVFSQLNSFSQTENFVSTMSNIQQNERRRIQTFRVYSGRTDEERNGDMEEVHVCVCLYNKCEKDVRLNRS